MKVSVPYWGSHYLIGLLTFVREQAEHVSVPYWGSHYLILDEYNEICGMSFRPLLGFSLSNHYKT